MSQAPYKRLILANSTFLKFDLPYFIPPWLYKNANPHFFKIFHSARKELGVEWG